MADLIQAVVDDKIITVRKLIEFGADVNYRNEKNDTPVLLAKSVNILKLLIENGAKYEYSHNIEYDDLYELGLYDNVHDFSKEIGSRNIYTNSTILNNYDYTQNPNLITDSVQTKDELLNWKDRNFIGVENFFLNQFGFIKKSGQQVNFTDIFDKNRCDDISCSYTKYTKNYILFNDGNILDKTTIPYINKVNFYQDAACRRDTGYPDLLTGVDIFSTSDKNIKLSIPSLFDPVRGEFRDKIKKTQFCDKYVNFPSFNKIITPTNKYYTTDNITNTNILFNSNCNVEMTCKTGKKSKEGIYKSLHYCFIRKNGMEYIADSSIAKARKSITRSENLLKHIADIIADIKRPIIDSLKSDEKSDGEKRKIVWINLLVKRLADSGQALYALKDPNGCLITQDRMLVMLAIVYGVKYIIYCQTGLPSSVLIRKDMFTEKSKQQSVIRETAVIERSIPVGITMGKLIQQIRELRRNIYKKNNDMVEYLYQKINRLNGGTNGEINNKYIQILGIMKDLILISTYYSKTKKELHVSRALRTRTDIDDENVFAKKKQNRLMYYNNLKLNYEKIKSIIMTRSYSNDKINLFEKINLHNIGNKNASLETIYGGYRILLKFFKSLINDKDKNIFDNLINKLCTIYDEYIENIEYSYKKKIICKRVVNKLLYYKRYSGDDENIKCSFNSRVKPPMSGGGPTTNFFDLQEYFVSGLYLLNNISSIYNFDISGAYTTIFTPYFEYMSKKLSPEEYAKLEIFNNDEDPEKYYWIEPIKNTFVFINYIQYQMENYPELLEVYNKISTSTEEDVEYFHTFLTALVPQLHTIMLQMLAMDSEEPTTPIGSITSSVESTHTKTPSPTDTIISKPAGDPTGYSTDVDGDVSMGSGAAASGAGYLPPTLDRTIPYIVSPTKAPSILKSIINKKRKRETSYDVPIKKPRTYAVSTTGSIVEDPVPIYSTGGKKKTRKYKHKKKKRTIKKRINKKKKRTIKKRINKKKKRTIKKRINKKKKKKTRKRR